MAKYILIESRDPFESRDTSYFFDLAIRLARSENKVTLFLVQNGVLPTRAGEHSLFFAELSRAGVEVVADSFSLKERGIAPARLASGVQPAETDLVVDRLAEGRKVLWH